MRSAMLFLLLSMGIGCANEMDGGNQQESLTPMKDVRIVERAPIAFHRAGPTTEKVLVGYYASWTKDVLPIASIPFERVTHIAHSFVLPSATGGLKGVSTYADPALIAAAHAKGTKVIASVGGWGANFDANVDASVRAKTVSAMASLCKTYGYDGIDLDWEFPTAATAPAWSAMISELRSALDAIDPDLSISAAISAGRENLEVLPKSALEKLSFIGVMTYDYAGPWSKTTGHTAPLFASKGGDGGNVADSIKYLTDTIGVRANKLLVGLPFYGYEFAANTLAASPVAPSNGIDYRNLAKRAGTSGWVKSYDSGAQVPYLTRAASPGFTTFDDEVSIAAKCSFASSKGLGGAIIWHLAGDRMVDGSQPLLDAAQKCR
jgi:chitinase